MRVSIYSHCLARWHLARPVKLVALVWLTCLCGCSSSNQMHFVTNCRLPSLDSVNVANDVVDCTLLVKDFEGTFHEKYGGPKLSVGQIAKSKEFVERNYADHFAEYLRRRKIFVEVTRDATQPHDLWLLVNFDDCSITMDIDVQAHSTSAAQVTYTSTANIKGTAHVYASDGQVVKTYPLMVIGPPYQDSGIFGLEDVGLRTESMARSHQEEASRHVAKFFDELASSMLADHILLERYKRR